MTEQKDAGPAPAALPVDRERLKKEFPQLTPQDLDAYVDVTRRVLADPQAKSRVIREVMESARVAREKAKAGATLSAQEALSVRYLDAIQKIQKKPAPSQ